ncbi:MAG: SAM-dependent methyltransferase [Chlamydiales bacterium]|nr:SAM-dependent methyltransferase [Chlamydiales bacterium]
MTLFLLPNVLGPVEDIRNFLPKNVSEVVSRLDGLIAESEGEGRRYLKRFPTKKKPHEMPIALLNKQTAKDELDFLLEPLIEGEDWGVVSDAGLPCLADPGAALVWRARQRKIPVEALIGPSSIILALMLSGLSGQQFFFHGYIPKKPEERERALKSWEKIKGTTHIFIEAPYRNDYTLDASLKTLSPQTLLSVGVNLTLPDQIVQTALVGEWKEFEIGKRPAVFLFMP